jgi:hypothetical protein
MPGAPGIARPVLLPMFDAMKAGLRHRGRPVSPATPFRK